MASALFFIGFSSVTLLLSWFLSVFFLPAMAPALAFLFDMAFVTLSFLLLFISLSILAMVLVLISIVSLAIVVDPMFGL